MHLVGVYGGEIHLWCCDGCCDMLCARRVGYYVNSVVLSCLSLTQPTKVTRINGPYRSNMLGTCQSNRVWQLEAPTTTTEAPRAEALTDAALWCRMWRREGLCRTPVGAATNTPTPLTQCHRGPSGRRGSRRTPTPPTRRTRLWK